MKNEKTRKVNNHQCINNTLLMNLTFYKRFMKAYNRMKIDSKNDLNILLKKVFTSFKTSTKSLSRKKSAFVVQLLKVLRKENKINQMNVMHYQHIATEF